MNLVAFQVTNYKVIEDSTRVTVDSRVTALVGKNESGKSAVLHALWKSRNHAGVRFDRLYDYPRGGVPATEREPRIATVLEFSLSEEEIEDLTNQMSDVLSQRPTKVFYKSSYTAGKSIQHTVELDSAPVEVSIDEVRHTIQKVMNDISEYSRR